jgi:hypothetical protein
MKKIEELDANQVRAAHYAAVPEQLRTDLADLIMNRFRELLESGDEALLYSFCTTYFSTYGSLRYPQSEALSKLMSVPNAIVLSNVGRVLLRRRGDAEVREVEKIFPTPDLSTILVWFNDSTFDELREIKELSSSEFINQIEVYIDPKLGYTPINMLWR